MVGTGALRGRSRDFYGPRQAAMVSASPEPLDSLLCGH